MTSPKRILLIGTPFLFLALGAGLNAAPNRLIKCGQPATRMAAFLQKLGFAGKTQPCEAAPPYPGSPGEWCLNDGHHCNDGNGSGKCTTVSDGGEFACVCKPNGK